MGDLSPKQKEALDKVSPPPGRPPPGAAALSLPRLRAGKGLGRRRATVLGGQVAEEAAVGGTWRPPPIAHRPPRGPPGKFATPAPAPKGALGGTTWEEVVAWKPLEAAQGTKATFISGLAAGPWDQGPRSPPISGRFSSSPGSGTDGKGPGQLLRIFG